MHYHFVRERVLSGEVKLQYVSTDRQNADIFTKPLGLDKLQQFLGVLGLHHLEKTEDELETTNSDESQN